MTADSEHSTICAISTPPGIGGIAVVRVSGQQAVEIVGRLWRGQSLAQCASHSAHLGWIVDSCGERLDQAVATVFRAPRSYTGDDTVELSVHGSPFIQREVLNALIAAGCRLAEPGEFTRRAFSAGRMDLAEAEAVADLIAATSRASHRLAISQMRGDFSKRIARLRESLLELASLLELELDFSDQEVEFASRERLMALATEVHDTTLQLAATFHRGEALRTGIPTAIVGATNVGKSTLLNRLLHDDRAIVSDLHGTTRDTVEDTTEIGGITFRFIDTAGLRDTSDTIEALGIDRSLQSVGRAAIIILMADASRPATLADSWRRIAPILAHREQHSAATDAAGVAEASPTPPCSAILLVWNKADIASPPAVDSVADQSMASEPGVEQQIAAFCHDHGIELRRAAYCARSGAGCDINDMLLSVAGADALSMSDVVVTNVRHYQSLAAAAEASARVISGLTNAISLEFVVQDLRQTLDYLGEITGAITTPQILSSIFSRFCIGK